jgi:hypothetical protein
MEYLAVFVGVTVFPLLFGYVMGRSQVDPNTKEGAVYYIREQ